MQSTLCDVCTFARSNTEAEYFEELPLTYVMERLHARDAPFDTEVVMIGILKYGNRGDVDAFRYKLQATPSHPELSVFLHPYFETYVDGKFVRSLHLLENLENEFKDEACHVRPLRCHVELAMEAIAPETHVPSIAAPSKAAVKESVVVGAGPQKSQQVNHDISVVNSLNDYVPSTIAMQFELPLDHPGRGDAKYTAKRAQIFSACLNGKAHDMEFTIEDKKAWAVSVTELQDILPVVAVSEFLRGYSIMSFDPEILPGHSEVNSRLAPVEWRLIPVCGTLKGLAFLSHFAEKRFPSVIFLRHHSNPSFSPEPDWVHEAIGHCPMILCKEYSNLLRVFGLCARQAAGNRVEAVQLIRLYGYTIECGLAYEGGQLKAWGAAHLSSASMMRKIRDGELEVIPLTRENALALPFFPNKDGCPPKVYSLPGKLLDGCEWLTEILGDRYPAIKSM